VAVAASAAYIVIGVQAVSGVDLQTQTGRVYRGIKITKIEPDGIRIVHESGSGKVPLEELPADWQSRLGYDSSMGERNRTPAKQVMVSIPSKSIEEGRVLLLGRVVANFQEGLLVECGQPEVWRKFGLTASASERLNLEGKKLDENGEADDETRAYIAQKWILTGRETVLYFDQSTLFQCRDTAVEKYLPRRVNGRFFLKGHPQEASLHADSVVSSFAYPDGSFTYRTPKGAASVAAYSVTKPRNLSHGEIQPPP